MLSNIAIEASIGTTYEMIIIYGQVVRVGDTNMIAERKMQVRTKIINEGKNKRSNLQEVIFESCRKYRNKIRKNYTSTPLETY